jgi:cytochrome c551/c552
MRRALRIGLGVLVVALAGAQLVPVSRTNPSPGGEIKVPVEVAPLLRRACYDCHSNQTVWPWYSRVAPASWLVAHDVRHGREDLNFSTWTDAKATKRTKKLLKVAEEVREGEMPPWYYALVHPEARLTAAERTVLEAWTAAEISNLSR